MVRLVTLAALCLSLPAMASGNPPAGTSDLARNFQVPRPDSGRFDTEDRLGRTQIAPNTMFGFGVFGLKSDKSPLRPATGRELDLPKQRRAAVGISLKF